MVQLCFYINHPPLKRLVHSEDGAIKIKVIIFSHESDLDGIYSAAIALIRYPQAQVMFLGYGIECFKAMEKLIHHEIDSSQEKGIIIVSDLGLIDDNNLINLCKQVFSEVMKKNWRAIWVDHHPWSSDANEALKPYIELVFDDSGNKCAADLMYEKFLAGNALAAKLASMANSMDFFTGAEYLTPTAELIRYSRTFSDYCNRLTVLAQKAARGILWDVEMQSEYNKYVKLRDFAKREAFSSMRINQINGYNVVFIKSSPYIQNSLFAQEIFEKTNADIAMLYSSDGNVSIRRNNDSIACNEIAANLPSGGGHKFAAGASYYSSPLDTNSIISELHQAVLETVKRKELQR